MEYARGEGRGWRSRMEKWLNLKLGHTVFNPNVVSRKYLATRIPGKNFRLLKSRDIAAYTRIARGIVNLDSKEIAYRSDYLICFWDRSAQQGAGTKGEVTVAKFFRKPVYLVTKQKPQDIPGWVLGCTTNMFGSFAELKAYLLRKYDLRR